MGATLRVNLSANQLVHCPARSNIDQRVPKLTRPLEIFCLAYIYNPHINSIRWICVDNNQHKLIGSARSLSQIYSVSVTVSVTRKCRSNPDLVFY